jgi:hypothetical protein
MKKMKLSPVNVMGLLTVFFLGLSIYGLFGFLTTKPSEPDPSAPVMQCVSRADQLSDLIFYLVVFSIFSLFIYFFKSDKKTVTAIKYAIIASSFILLVLFVISNGDLPTVIGHDRCEHYWRF